MMMLTYLTKQSKIDKWQRQGPTS